MKINEVSKLLGVEPYVLRYWETEFPQLRPKRTQGGQRIYGEEDITFLRRLVELLHVQRFTIAGARRYLAGEPLLPSDRIAPVAEPEAPVERTAEPAPSAQVELAVETLRRVRKQLIELRERLNRPSC